MNSLGVFVEKMETGEVRELPWGQREPVYGQVCEALEESFDGVGVVAVWRPPFLAGELEPGARDGVYAYHFHSVGEVDTADSVLETLKLVFEDPTPMSFAHFYDTVRSPAVIEYVDPLMERLVLTGELEPTAVKTMAKFLAMRAPDREPVKLGLALMGSLSGADTEELEVLTRISLCEEFTLFGAVALAQKMERPTKRLWWIAKRVHGWGRIHLVRILANRVTPEIQRWLVSEGYSNTVGIGYLACLCAERGDLLSFLSVDEVDENVLKGAGEILGWLTEPGQGEEMDDYADGAVAVERYLQHLQNSGANSIDRVLALVRILDFLEDEEADWDSRVAVGWTLEKRKKHSKTIHGLLFKAPLEHLVCRALKGPSATRRLEGVQVTELLPEELGGEWVRAALSAAKTKEDRPKVVDLIQRVSTRWD